MWKTFLALCTVLCLGGISSGSTNDALPEDVVFLIGSADASAAEFRNHPDWKAFAAKVPDKKEPVPFLKFEVGKNPDSAWTAWHWSTMEAKAGFRKFLAEIVFSAKRDYPEKMYLVLAVAHGSPSSSQVHVTTNGVDSPVKRAPTTRCSNPWGSFQVKGSSLLLPIEIPGGTIRQGENRIQIMLDDGSFLFYDYVALRARPEAIPPKPQPSMVEEFLSHGMPEEILFVTRKPSRDGHWYANIGYYADNVCRLPWQMNSGGAIYIYNIRTRQVRKIFEDKEGNFRDPQIHYDGKKFVFAYLPGGKRHYSLYEMNLDGTGLRQITGIGEDKPLELPAGVEPATTPEHRISAKNPGNARDFAAPGWDDYEPTYTPDDQIIFCSTRSMRWVNCWVTQCGTIHKCDLNGKNIRRLSANVEQDNTPWFLPDGRVIYMRWEYVDRGQVQYHHLWTMNPDGTKQMVFYGNQRPWLCMLGAKPIPNTNKVVVTLSPGHGMKEHFGPIGIIDPSFGPDDLRGIQYLTRDSNHSDPWAFDENHVLCGTRNSINLLTADGREEVLYTLPTSLQKEGYWIAEPRPVMPRAREEIIADQTDDSKNYGTLALANIYRGRQMKDLKPGTVKYLLIYETLPKPIHYSGGMEQVSSEGTFTLERLLGRVPVSEEGSAYFNLPAGRPFLFLAMDENNHCVKRMHSFTCVMPGEVNACIGCHEERTETPNADDRDRLNRMMKTQPSDPELVEGVPHLFDFPRDIQPILDKHCLECHNHDREEGGFNISGDWNPVYTIGYMQMSWRKMFGDNRNRAMSNFPPYAIGTGSSHLLKLIETQHEGVNMPEAEQKIIRHWLDAGANYAGTYAANASGGMGYYMQNHNVRNDRDWPEAAATREAITRRCDPCHCPTEEDRKIGRYNLATDYKVNHDPRSQKNMFVAHDMCEDNGRFNRFVIYNLSYPEKSKVLRGPLSKSAGGLGTCEAKSGKVIFADTADPDYQTILKYIQRGRTYLLEEDNRFSMLNPSPNNGKDCPQRFVPRWAYVREMIRYGLLPVDTPPGTPLNPYELDQKYWETFWKK
ncbi:MAG: polysaccharide lyase family protein [Planctomycetia bacterium]|nr:polysaccharide lyase family protein [Planctomycetia bacterium]